MGPTRSRIRNPRIVRAHRARWLVYPLFVLIAVPLFERIWQRHDPYNGFDVAAGNDAAAHIEGGGPGRDDIPALDEPPTLRADEAHFLAADDRVLGIVVGGEARAYPLAILNWHEVVNDRIAGDAVLVTWCPLCRSGLAFSPFVNGTRLRFGVSGLLYNGNLLMYDRDSESLWSQIEGEAVSGPRRGQRLEQVAVTHDTWARWRRRHPRTTVLSVRTGFDRDYGHDAYGGLHQRARAAAMRTGNGSGPDGGLAPQALVLGVERRGQARAWPLTRLALDAPAGEIEDHLGDEMLRIRYDAIAGTAEVRDRGAVAVPATITYWSVWQRFHPDSEIWSR